jgi:hypothetical protein
VVVVVVVVDMVNMVVGVLWVFTIPGPDCSLLFQMLRYFLGLFVSVRMSADLCPFWVHNFFETKVLV